MFKILIFLSCLSLILSVAKGEEELERAIQVYKSCQFEKASQILENLLKSGQLKNKAEQIRAYQHLAFCYSFLEQEELAVAAFVKLLQLLPEARFDEKTIPPEILKYYQKAKKKIRQMKEKEEKQIPPAQHEEKEEKLPPVKKESKLGNIFFPFAPFGSPQFQKKQLMKGWGFCLWQLGSLATSILAHYEKEKLKIPPEEQVENCGVYRNPREAKKWQNIQRISFAFFVLGYGWSVVEAHW
jgi:tetratricopeptide (TPR) repeat protein